MKRFLKILLGIVLLISLITVMILNQSKFGQHPKGERLERIKKSPNYKNGSFKNLSELELKSDFTESVIDKKTGKKKKFFNLGPSNDWKKLLDKDIRLEIEVKFNIEMRELGYL